MKSGIIYKYKRMESENHGGTRICRLRVSMSMKGSLANVQWMANDLWMENVSGRCRGSNARTHQPSVQ